MIKPTALKPNATIGILSPSSWMNESDLKLAIAVFEEKGYRLMAASHFEMTTASLPFSELLVLLFGNGSVTLPQINTNL